MPKFITVGYGDQKGYDSTPRSIRDDAHAQDQLLLKKGAVMGIAGSPVQVRNHQGHGAYMTSALPLAGFAVIDAASLSEEIAMVSKSPCAIANGVVEVWPLEQPK
jgi:hypothetical protein